MGGHRLMKKPDTIDSKFRYILIAAERCTQLQKGAKPKIDTQSTKYAAIAQKEVSQGLVDFKVVEEEDEADEE
jgi:DNA-directed RNA polymerase subunit omega